MQSECQSKLNVSEIICHRCNKPGHKAPDCRSTVSPAPQRPYVGYKDRECYICHKTRHISRDCKKIQTASVAVNCVENAASVHKGSACVQINTHVPCCDDTKCGKMLPIFSGACHVANDEMPVTKGLVGSMEVEMLRDTGCSGVVVSRSMISDDQLLDKTERCMLIDGSILKVPMACIDIDTPYFTGKSIEAMVMKSPVYDLVVGNIPGARKADDPIKDWQPQVESDVDQTASAVMMRAAVKRDSKPLKPLHVTQSDVSKVVDVKNLAKMQTEDKSLDKVRKFQDKRKRGKNVHWFSHEGGILYRYFQSLM